MRCVPVGCRCPPTAASCSRSPTTTVDCWPRSPAANSRAAVRRGEGLGRPPAVDRYTHTPAQERFVCTRDRTCRHPGCSNRAGWADLDHVVPHAHGGATDCANLCCLCRRHHRLKTFASGWLHVMTPDGVLSVTTPSGITRVSRPPGMRPDDDGILRVAAERGRPVDDPPPF